MCIQRMCVTQTRSSTEPGWGNVHRHHLLDDNYGSSMHTQSSGSLLPVIALPRCTHPRRSKPPLFRPQETEEGRYGQACTLIVGLFQPPPSHRPEVPLTTLSSGTDRLRVHSWLFTKASARENGKCEVTCHNSRQI